MEILDIFGYRYKHFPHFNSINPNLEIINEINSDTIAIFKDSQTKVYFSEGSLCSLGVPCTEEKFFFKSSPFTPSKSLSSVLINDYDELTKVNLDPISILNLMTTVRLKYDGGRLEGNDIKDIVLYSMFFFDEIFLVLDPVNVIRLDFVKSERLLIQNLLRGKKIKQTKIRPIRRLVIPFYGNTIEDFSLSLDIPPIDMKHVSYGFNFSSDKIQNLYDGLIYSFKSISSRNIKVFKALNTHAEFFEIDDSFIQEEISIGKVRHGYVRVNTLGFFK